MGIIYCEKEQIFRLDTPRTSYMIGIADEEGFVGHLYYGKKIKGGPVSHLFRTEEIPFTPSVNKRDRIFFLDRFPMEYSTYGVGDYREACLSVQNSEGYEGTAIFYRSHKIYAGKKKIEGLPASFAEEDECMTLELICLDPILNLEVTLVYSVFEKVDVITRHVRLKNLGADSLKINKILSACLDMDNHDYELITLYGAWGRERHIQRNPVMYGKQGVSSLRGESSHQEHPFIALAEKSTTQDTGEIYGMHFVYSGNFLAQAERSQFDSIRAVMGIHPEGFSWKLMPNEEFSAPETVMVYSSEGIGGMSRTLHDFYREHLIRGEYKNKKRPVLINNWEATYFDFDSTKLINIAKEAAESGIEMLVMDDGWFGKRETDETSLGDWIVNEEKLKGGLANLVSEVEKLGLKFGIWFEPEMVSPDSDLYRAHPDWVIQIPAREAALSRNQYVLDLSRKEVVDYVYSMLRDILNGAGITYVKWDMNRPLSDFGSYALKSDEQGELCHRYLLGVYELQERLIQEFPNLLLENCSSGGARFDPGMLYYSPQIWCSDDTDAIERLLIQEGTAMIYPLSTMGAHVSDCPNHAIGRNTPFATRGYVALAGTFGYELDITKISKEDREMIPLQIAMYHRYNELIRTGDYYRIESYSENHLFDCWETVSKDKKRALVTAIQVMAQPNVHSRRIRLKGLNPEFLYQLVYEETGKDLSGESCLYTGDVLMYAGINLPELLGDFTGRLIYLESVDK